MHISAFENLLSGVCATWCAQHVNDPEIAASGAAEGMLLRSVPQPCMQAGCRPVHTTAHSGGVLRDACFWLVILV